MTLFCHSHMQGCRVAEQLAFGSQFVPEINVRGRCDLINYVSPAWCISPPKSVNQLSPVSGPPAVFTGESSTTLPWSVFL